MRASILVLIVSVAVGIAIWWYFQFVLRSTESPLDWIALIIAVGLGLSNFLFSREQHIYSLLPQVRIYPKFVPKRYSNKVVQYTHNALKFTLANLHQNVAVIDLQITSRVRTVKPAGGWIWKVRRWLRKYKQMSWMLPLFQWLTSLKDKRSKWFPCPDNLTDELWPSERKEVRILHNLEMNVHDQFPGIIRELRQDGYVEYETDGGPTLLEIEISFEYNAAVHGISKQRRRQQSFLYAINSGSSPGVQWIRVRDRI